MNAARWDRIAPLAGIGFVALVIVGFGAGGELPHGKSAAEVRDYFADHRSGLIAAAYLFGLAGIPLLWFLGSLRSHLARAEGEVKRLSDVAFGGGVAFLALATAGSALLGTLAWRSSEPLDAELAAMVFSIGHALFHFADVAIAATLLATAVVAIRTGCLRAWLAWGTLGLGAFVLAVRAIPEESYGTERLGLAEFALMLAWFVAASVALARARSIEHPDVRVSAPAPSAG